MRFSVDVEITVKYSDDDNLRHEMKHVIAYELDVLNVLNDLVYWEQQRYRSRDGCYATGDIVVRRTYAALRNFNFNTRQRPIDRYIFH